MLPGAAVRFPGSVEKELLVATSLPVLVLGLRELRASALCPGLEAQFPARRREERAHSKLPPLCQSMLGSAGATTVFQMLWALLSWGLLSCLPYSDNS